MAYHFGRLGRDLERPAFEPSVFGIREGHREAVPLLRPAHEADVDPVDPLVYRDLPDGPIQHVGIERFGFLVRTEEAQPPGVRADDVKLIHLLE